MDSAARIAITATLVGLVDAEVLDERKLEIVLASIDDAATSAGGSDPDVETALEELLATVRHISRATLRKRGQSR